MAEPRQTEERVHAGRGELVVVESEVWEPKHKVGFHKGMGTWQ